MTGGIRDAAGYLFARSAVNRARQMGQRLRSPRYLIAVLLGAGYLLLVFFGQPRTSSPALSVRGIEWGGSVLLAVFALKWWLFGADRTALAFTPPEIQFLFPAPVSRSDLLLLKLMRAQLPILVSVLLWTVLLHRHGAQSLPNVLYGIGLWGFFCIIFLHRLGVALQRDATSLRGWSAWLRLLPVLLLIGGAIWIAIDRTSNVPAIGRLGRLHQLIETAPLSWLIWPFRLPVLPLAAVSIGEWLWRFGVVLLLLALHLWWVIRADVAFEEAAVEATQRRSALMERWRRQGAMAPSPHAAVRQWRVLSPHGHPGRAILWKNFTRLIRTVRPVFPLIVVGMIAAGLLVGMVSDAYGEVALALVAGLSLSWAAMFTILGPQWIRIDLRGELDHLPMLRTWPVSGLVIMTAQVASSALVLSALQVVLGLGGLTALVLTGEVPMEPLQAVALIGPAILLLLAINVIALAIQNGGALLYPSWVRMELRPGGIEMVGQQFLTAGASMVLLTVALLGPGLLAGGGGYLLWPRLGVLALVPAALLATAGLALEAFLMLDWLGTRFERFDPSGVN